MKTTIDDAVQSTANQAMTKWQAALVTTIKLSEAIGAATTDKQIENMVEEIKDLHRDATIEIRALRFRFADPDEEAKALDGILGKANLATTTTKNLTPIPTVNAVNEVAKAIGTTTQALSEWMKKRQKDAVVSKPTNPRRRGLSFVLV